MGAIRVSTEVYAPAAEVYEFLLDFPRYAEYSKHLRAVRRDGDGSPGTGYELDFAWWRLSYTAHSRVTGVDPPNRIDWTVTKDLDARGRWRIEPAPEAAPAGAPTACRVFFEVTYDAGTVSDDAVDLPAFLSPDWLIDRVQPKIRTEAERVVERVVADLEGEPRPVDLAVHRAG